MINSCAEIQAYLKNNPLTFKNIEIVLFISDNGNSIFHPNISIAAIKEGVLEYITTEKANPLTYKTEIEESYEEALRKISDQNKSPLSSDS